MEPRAIIEEKLEEVTGMRGIDESADLTGQLGISPLCVIEVVTELEEQYDFKVPNRDLGYLRSIKDLEAYTFSHGKKVTA